LTAASTAVGWGKAGVPQRSRATAQPYELRRISPIVALQPRIRPYIYGAVEPTTDNAFALVLSEANTKTTQVFLDKFAETIASNEHVAMFLDLFCLDVGA
jgi:hypothetical protein